MEQSRLTVSLYEGDPFSDVGGDQPQLRDKLIEAGVLRPSPDGTPTIRFVGVAVSGPLTLVMLPKVRLTSPPNDVIHQTLRALRTYAQWIPSSHDPSPHLNADPDRGHVSGIAVTDWLIRDFLSYGLYRRTYVNFEVNGSGKTNWQSTIGMRQPIFSRRRPIYIETVTRRSENDPSNFATMLHLHMLEALSGEYGPLLDCYPIHLDHEPVDRFELLPSADECERLLMAEMRNVYDERSLLLLSMLVAAVKALEVERARDLALFGTASFHHVWEAACGRVCGNEVEEWQRSLPAPLWRSTHGASQTAETFRPDIVIPLHDDQNGLLVADAKYYRPTMPPSLSGVPGVNDVAKQIWYKQYLLRAATDRGYDRIENVFLFPGPEGRLVEVIGYVEFPEGGERIAALKIDFMQAMRAYADRSNRLQVGVRKEMLAAIAKSDLDVEFPFEQDENIA